MKRFVAAIALLPLLAAALPAEVIRLDTGEVLRARIVNQQDGQLTLEHAILGTITLPADRVAAIEPTDAPEPDEAAEAAPAAEPQPATPPEAAEAEPEPRPSGLMATLKRWNTSIEIGASATRGNSETADLRIAASAERETEARRIGFEIGYYGASADNRTTNNELAASLLHDWLLAESPWFYFVGGDYDFDQFEDWRHRVAANAGVGYTWNATDALQVVPRAGFGFAREFGGDDDQIRPEALAGARVAWKPEGSHAVEAASFIYPDLDEFGESRIESSLSWSMDLPDLEGMAFKWGLEHEYESRTEGDQQHNDLKLFATMVFDF